ncbi:MAG: hypothetical protein NZ531_03185 [Aquificaceae bacterium]|nr:hypothetical protein [Aquificaceae bacterium]
MREYYKEGQEFKSLLKWTLLGYVGGPSLGVFLDNMGFNKKPLGEWAVRTLSGEGESLFEGLFALVRRLKGYNLSMAEVYGWGKFAGMTFPWFVDFLSRLLGINVYGVEGFYIPYFYALSDQIGANLAGLIFLVKRSGSPRGVLKAYTKNPVMLTSLMVVLLVPIGLIVARLLGFSPTKNLYVALETISANLCWLPPLAGVLWERKAKKEGRT